MTKIELRLYVSGRTPQSELAIENLRRIRDGELRGACNVEVIDVLEHPARVEADKILATPALVKRFPPPMRRIVGDLSDPAKVLNGLDLLAHEPDAPS